MYEYWTFEHDGQIFGGHYSESECKTQEKIYDFARDELSDYAPTWVYLIKYRVTDDTDKGADDLTYEELERVETFIEGPSQSALAEHGTWYKGCAL